MSCMVTPQIAFVIWSIGVGLFCYGIGVAVGYGVFR